MQKLKWILQLSRPRFWFYLIGPLLLGVASYVGFTFSPADGNFQAGLLLALVFFSLPANLLIYGLNDLFDYETDKHNPKKKAYESLLEPSQRKTFTRLLSIVVLPPLLLLLISLLFTATLNGGLSLSFNPNGVALWSLTAFLFFGIGYSVPPVRAKVRPFIDSFFNILYVFPGLVAYGILTEQFPPLQIIIAATLWCMAMHAFSAVPDIISDKKAHLATIATKLGTRGTIMFCAVCYALAASLTYEYLGILSIIGSTLYLSLMYLSYTAKKAEDIFKIYTIFPYANVIFGFVLFWFIILTR